MATFGFSPAAASCHSDAIRTTANKVRLLKAADRCSRLSYLLPASDTCQTLPEHDSISDDTEGLKKHLLQSLHQQSHCQKGL